MLEKARQAERLEAERSAARQRYDRYREAVEVSTELDGLAQAHPSPNPLPVIRQSVGRLRSLDGRIRELEVQFEVGPEPTWRPLRTWGGALAIVGIIAVLAIVALRTVGIVDLGLIP